MKRNNYTISSALAGGDFFTGMASGIISAGLNHTMHAGARGVGLEVQQQQEQQREEAKSGTPGEHGSRTFSDSEKAMKYMKRQQRRGKEHAATVHVNQDGEKLYVVHRLDPRGVVNECYFDRETIQYYINNHGEVTDLWHTHPTALNSTVLYSTELIIDGERTPDYQCYEEWNHYFTTYRGQSVNFIIIPGLGAPVTYTPEDLIY